MQQRLRALFLFGSAAFAGCRLSPQTTVGRIGQFRQRALVRLHLCHNPRRSTR